ncbi:type II toxin-antitoxin system YafO family toxin [Achromobacter mucicolens]|uniref:type II toxin-antitoxin system YafO family toxin n=1 Tax=Achromobacter mucicolens TaxID=1389922 RepID=UPI0020A29371|nr:type II toxin-antitoxin system YafO family toxin [Achromobacter mucicolens]MCP2518652.1 type II toxin-antitoxin system YafO family toxin [Achromobacter mucicolens]
MTTKKPKVQITAILSDKLKQDNKDVNVLIEQFASWKELGPAGEYTSSHFGKDSFYSEPKVDGQMVLRHVHLRPVQDLEKQRTWDRQHRFQGKKSSDVALLYAADSTHGYLLIDILREPDAHEVARMATAQHKDYMEKMAQVADAFNFCGEILI